MDVLIVEPLEPEVLQWLGSRHTVRVAPELARDPRAFRHALYDVRALIIPPSVPIDASALRLAPMLRTIGRLGAGVENIDLVACAAAGVEVVRPATASATAEAEFMVGALLQMLRRVPVVSTEGMLVGRELGSCRVGIIGMSPAAKPLAELLRAFGCHIVGYDPAVHASDSLWSRWHVTPIGLRELIEQCDAVCVLLNYFTRYQGLIGERYLQHCKRDQVLVSLTHASLFDEWALAEALQQGRLAAAWLDSVEPGLLAPGRALHEIDTLQVTPRVAATTRESRLRAAWAVVRRIDEVLNAPAPLAQFKPTAPDDPLDLEDGSEPA
jgi:D-3-phosphoglycerate dehydrogenase / 2-oxoglutarate reductase